MRIGSGVGASAGIDSSPRANAAAAVNVAASLASGVLASRQARAAANNEAGIGKISG